MRSSRKRAVAVASGLAAALLLAACSGGASGGATGGASASGGAGNVTIEFFQSKRESVDTVDKIIAAFEASHPGITVNQNNTPDALTVFQSRLAKNDIPDVIALNASNYNDIVSAGILADLAGTPAAEAVTDTGAVDYLKKIGKTEDLTALPWSVNAQIVLYDKAQLADLGLQVPTTWTELLATAQAIKDAGKNPFYFTWKDSWTAKMLFNSVAGPLAPDDFWDQLDAGTATFADSPEYQDAADKMLKLKEFAQEDPFGKGYDEGNAAFANGESVMYVQGIWAISEITKVNPDIDLGAFVFPSSDDADQNAILSGPDSFVALSNASAHPKEAQEFVDYLFSAEAQKTFADEQHLFSVRSDVVSDDELLAGLKTDWLDEGRTALYPDGMFRGSSDLSAIVQDFLYKGDVPAFLTAVDADWATNGI